MYAPFARVILPGVVDMKGVVMVVTGFAPAGAVYSTTCVGPTHHARYGFAVLNRCQLVPS